MTRTNFSLFGALTCAAALAACDASSQGVGGQVRFNVATSGGISVGAPFDPDTLTDASGNVLVLTKVELVLRDIEFERQNHDDCDSVSTGNDDDCEEFEAGPVLIDLPLRGGVSHEFTVAVEAGTFDEIEFQIHKPEDDGDARDLEFIAAHPDLEDVSIRVTGSFNGTAFTFTSDLNVEQEIDLNPPLVVGTQTDVAVTLKVDLSGWFLSGAVLIDPSLAIKGGPLEGLVKSNIEASFDAFNDENEDGESDD